MDRVTFGEPTDCSCPLLFTVVPSIAQQTANMPLKATHRKDAGLVWNLHQKCRHSLGIVGEGRDDANPCVVCVGWAAVGSTIRDGGGSE